jgi:hypothetical protein
VVRLEGEGVVAVLCLAIRLVRYCCSLRAIVRGELNAEGRARFGHITGAFLGG